MKIPTVTYAELAKHCSYSDAWISINGTVYDITRFVSKHPFGDTFRGSLGTECGGLFSSSHMNTNVEKWIQDAGFLARNGITVIGTLDPSGDRLRSGNATRYLNRIVYKSTRDDPFWLELKTRVRAYLQERGESLHYGSGEAVAYILYYAIIYVALSYLTWVSGSMLAALLLGLHMLCAVANISHMATHFGFVRNRWLNFTAEQFFDLGGMSWLEWQVEHQTHHNQPHSSIDEQTNQYDGKVATRIHHYVERKRHHRYQHLYFWAAVSPYLVFRFIMTSVWLYRNGAFVRHRYEVAAHVLARLAFLGQVVYCARLHGIWPAAGLFLLYALAYSHAAFLLLYNNYEDTHNVLSLTESIDAHHHTASWAEVQVRASSNWYPTNWFLSFVQFHYGYFNFHIEHHLFPALKPALLRKVSPIVKEVCEKHGIPYISTTFWQVQRSLYRHLTKLGAPARNDQPAERTTSFDEPISGGHGVRTTEKAL
jgi:linoleoyl-CoA desaturase